MRPSLLFFLSLAYFIRSFAAPTSATHVQNIVFPTVITHRPSTHLHSHTRSHTPPHSTGLTIPGPVASGPHTFPLTRNDFPYPTPSEPPYHHRFHHRGRQTPIVIFFEILSGLSGLALFFGILRCLHSYRRTPARDRIADVVQRHRLQVEMEELQRRRPTRTYVFPEPAPPYLPRPPSYAERTSEDSPPLLVHTFPADSHPPNHHHRRVDAGF